MENQRTDAGQDCRTCRVGPYSQALLVITNGNREENIVLVQLTTGGTGNRSGRRTVCRIL